jgi:sigma-B regulation protein RsbU (phosphoserine phosphatase)
VPEQNLALQKTRSGGFAPRPPAEAIAMLNRVIMSEMETEHYFTIALADVDLMTGHVIIAQAGHPYPALQRAGATVEFIGHGGLPVGLIDAAEFQQFEVTMAPGDRLLIHSDGVTECAARDGTLLDEAGLARILRDLRQTRGRAFLESLLWKLSDFAGDADFQDDISAVLLEFRPGPMPG